MNKKKRAKSARQKGNEYQIWIRDWLQECGWTVRNFPMLTNAIMIMDKTFPFQKRMVWIPKDNDVFGCDLVARKEGKILWIQASLDDHIARRMDTFAKYFKELSPDEILMLWIKREKWHSIKRVHFDPTGILTITDIGRIQSAVFQPVMGISSFYFGLREKKKERK